MVDDRPPTATPPRRWPDEWVESPLRSMGVLTPEAAERLQRMDAPSLWQACVRTGLATHDEILAFLSRRFNMAIADLEGADLSRAARLLTEDVARNLRVLPLGQNGRTIEVACVNPLDLDLERSIAFAAGKRVRLVLTDPDSLDDGLRVAYPQQQRAGELVIAAGPLDSGDGLVREIASLAEGQLPNVSTSDLVNALIVQALRQRASDVHFQPHDRSVGIRYRIDGAMHEIARLPRALLAPITSRLKVLANLDIADRMRPQDGRAQVQLGGRLVDLRISTLPVGTMGEKTVVRILDSGQQPHDLSSLGFLRHELDRCERLFQVREGLVLVTGPTGSGKTTTLYAALRKVQATGANIVTVEDPIEYRLDGIAQAQVNEKAGLTFASVLRSILRQDPDVVLIGEIRDRETAEIALQASMTGHLVLSTVHTNDAPSTIMRLVDIGVDPTALATSLRGVLAQRLVRRVCPDCRVACDVSSLAESQQALLAHLPNPTLYQAHGCPTCRGIGYHGRLVVPEIALVTTDVERAIAQGAEQHTLAELCRDGGLSTLWQSGLERVALGLTTLNELLDNITPPLLNRTFSTAPPQADVDAIFGAARVSAAPQPTDTGEHTVASTTVMRTTTRAADLSAARRRARPGAHRVLVLDESSESRHEMRSALERAGFAVAEAADGETGIEYLKRLTPDVLVLELALPKVDGIGVLRALRALDIATQPLVLTVQSDPELAVWAMELGAVDVLNKPMEPRLLANRLLALLAEAAA